MKKILENNINLSGAKEQYGVQLGDGKYFVKMKEEWMDKFREDCKKDNIEILDTTTLDDETILCLIKKHNMQKATTKNKRRRW